MLRFIFTVLAHSTEDHSLSEVVTNLTSTCVAHIVVRPTNSSHQNQNVLSHLKNLFQTANPTSALELHQFAEQFVTDAQRQNCSIDFVMALALEDKSIFAARNGAIVLKRGDKIGRILQSNEEIIVVEGSRKEVDEFVWLVGQISDPTIEWMKQKLTYFSSQGFTFNNLQKQWPNLMGDVPAEFHHLSVSSVVYDLVHTEPMVEQSAVLPVPQSDQVPLTPQPIDQKKQQKKTIALQLAALPAVFKGALPLLKRSVFYLQQPFRHLYADLFSQDVYVRQKNRKKILRVILPVLIIVIIGIISFVVIGSQRRQQLQAAQQAFQPLNARLTEIKQTVDQDPITARQKTEDVIVELEQVIDREKDHKITAAELTKYLQETRQFYDSISGKEEFSVLPTFYDLRYVESAFLANTVDMVDSTLVFLDKGQRKALAVNAENKQYTSLPIGDFPELKDFDFEGKSLYLLGNGISEFKMSESQPATQLKASDDQLQNAQLIRFFNQYLYAINPEKHNIFRYAFTDKTTLSDAAGWMKSGTTLEFEKVQSFAIDGDVWITTKDGKLKKFTSGKEMDFEITGISDPFSTAITVYTNQDLSNLYVLEPAKDRLVILNKKGEFLREVKSSSLKSTTTVVANENLKKAFVVSGALVFEIAL
jgi:hypothetical protein